jgi:hypothetical protein
MASSANSMASSANGMASLANGMIAALLRNSDSRAATMLFGAGTALLGDRAITAIGRRSGPLAAAGAGNDAGRG